MVSYSHFVMERPATMLAPVELAVLVDSIAGKGKRRLPSAFGAADGGTLQILMRIVGHCYLPLLALRLNDAPRIIRLGILMANLQKIIHPCKSKTPSDAFFVNSATVFVNSATPRGRGIKAPFIHFLSVPPERCSFVKRAKRDVHF